MTHYPSRLSGGGTGAAGGWEPLAQMCRLIHRQVRKPCRPYWDDRRHHARGSHPPCLAWCPPPDEREGCFDCEIIHGVIPAKAGIHFAARARGELGPCFREGRHAVGERGAAISVGAFLLPLREKVPEGRMRGGPALGASGSPLIRLGLRPIHLLPQGEKEADCDSPHPVSLRLRLSFATLPTRGRERRLQAPRVSGAMSSPE